VKDSGKVAAELLETIAFAGGERPRDCVLIGLAGRGIQASRSPIMHEREGARLGIAYRYVLIDFDALALADEDIGAIVHAAAELGFAGLNVTHPLKQIVIPHLHRLSPEAEMIGAVNTVVFRDGEHVGHNTDSWGFAEGMRRACPDCPLGRVIQFGAGGAGAAVAHALLELGVASLCVIDQDTGRADALARRLAPIAGERLTVSTDVEQAVATADGIVNATPAGMAKYPGTPFPTALLSSDQWVADIVYFPAETELLHAAKSLGCRTIPGMGMAIYQAVRAFELFTGVQPDATAMTAHFEAAA
jgi:shikimate dehydrogenase